MRTFTSLLFLFLFSCANQQEKECNYITDYYPKTTQAEIEFYLGNQIQ